MAPRPPGSVLFACNYNAVRSPMAEALMKRLGGARCFVQSAGVRAGTLDPFMVAVMREAGIELADHRPRSLAEVAPEAFDLVIALTDEAAEAAAAATRSASVAIERWQVPDPTGIHENRAQRLIAYRLVRDSLAARLEARFGPSGETG